MSFSFSIALCRRIVDSSRLHMSEMTDLCAEHLVENLHCWLMSPSRQESWANHFPTAHYSAMWAGQDVRSRPESLRFLFCQFLRHTFTVWLWLTVVLEKCASVYLLTLPTNRRQRRRHLIPSRPMVSQWRRWWLCWSWQRRVAGAGQAPLYKANCQDYYQLVDSLFS